MAKDPAFLFYPGDYLRDTQCLSEKSQVAYDRIMCEHMRNICISQQQLNFFIKRLSDEEKSEVMQLLKKISGGFQIEWVAESICKRRDYSKSRAENRKGKHKNISSTYDSHMEIENENVIENENKDKSENENLIFPFNSAEFMKLWGELVKSPKWKKKTISALQASLKKLSRHPEETALRMIEDCIAGNWQGLVEPKNNYNATHIGTTTSGKKLGTSDARIEALRNW